MTPLERWVERHNAACRRRAAAAPLHLILLSLLGFPGRHLEWQRRESLLGYLEEAPP